MRISDWSSDVCSSDLVELVIVAKTLELNLLLETIARHIFLNFRYHRLHRSADRCLVGSLAQREHRIAHDHGRLGGIEDDNRLALRGAPYRLNRSRRGARELVDIGPRPWPGRAGRKNGRTSGREGGGEDV